VYLDDVYVHGATKVWADAAPGGNFAGHPAGWLRVRRFAQPGAPRTNQGHTYQYSVYVDGTRTGSVREVERDRPPPAGLRARHLWGAEFPNFESAGAVNVRAAPYSAMGDGRTDDTAALQRAIDAHEIVFLPRGCYLVSRPLELKPRTQLVGVGQTMSLLVAARGGAFANPAEPAPLVRTADAAEARTILAFLGLYTPSNVAGAQSLHWRSGGDSVLRSVEIHGRGEVAPAPVIISGHGAGNWYNFRDKSARLLVDGARGPLRFYQFSVQQVTSELRGARHVSFYGTKYEGNNPMLVFRDCDHIRLFGHGGNGKGRSAASLFVFERTENFLFANAIDGPTKIGSKSLSHWEGSTDPRHWHMLIEQPADGRVLKLQPLERPVLYLRGSPAEAGGAIRGKERR
jgi:hypothetical protein